MKISRVLFLANAAIAGSMLLNSCGGVPEDVSSISGLQAYVKASNTGAADDFGFAVALSGDGNTLVVGAPGEASARTGVTAGIVDETTAGNAAPGAGAVYVYTRSGATWTQQAYIKASNPGAGDQFGTSVALSSDGITLAVGAPGEASADGNQADDTAASAGAVYVFTRDVSGVWSQQDYVKASNTDAGDQFGFSVALSGDGSTLAVGATGEDSPATGINGIQTNNTVAEAGAVYVYTFNGTTWTQDAYVKASNTGAGDQFGFSVALSSNGSTLAVGAVFESSIATGIDGNQASNTAPEAGAVYVFTRDVVGVWSQQAYVKASNTGALDRFGSSVSLSDNGNTLAVGAPGEASATSGNPADNTVPSAGAVYVFTRDVVGVWSQQAYVKASNTGALDLFGFSVSLSGDGNTLAVGAVSESSSATGIGGNQTDNTAADAGAVYVYTRSVATWTQQFYVKASNTGAGDHFGTSVALSDDGTTTTLAVGATGEDSSATGIDGNQADNSAVGAGAVYVF